jgi:CheY-like chemotaxis protein
LVARLLLIDDDIAEISAGKRVLARAGLSPMLATNASDAQAALAQRLPDLLLVGATCEGGEALALTQRLEEEPSTRGLPLIVLGAVSGAPIHAVVLPRPVDPSLLAEQVQALLAAGHPFDVEVVVDEEHVGGGHRRSTPPSTRDPTPTRPRLDPTPTRPRPRPRARPGRSPRGSPPGGAPG